MRVIVGKTFTFEAAHHLPYHDGKCKRLHGHSYKVDIEISGQVTDSPKHPEHGMVVDFGRLTKAWEQVWEPKLDHAVLNDNLPTVYPTAEWLAQHLFLYFESWASSLNLRCERVRVHETATSYAEVVHD